MTELFVKVNPGSKEFSVEMSSIPRIDLEQEAENGKANQELKNRLRDLTGEEVGIVSGRSSRRKKIVTDLDEDEFRRRIGEHDG